MAPQNFGAYGLRYWLLSGEKPHRSESSERLDPAGGQAAEFCGKTITPHSPRDVMNHASGIHQLGPPPMSANNVRSGVPKSPSQSLPLELTGERFLYKKTGSQCRSARVSVFFTGTFSSLGVKWRTRCPTDEAESSRTEEVDSSEKVLRVLEKLPL